MKKIVLFLLIAALCLSLSCCKAGNTPEPYSSSEVQLSKTPHSKTVAVIETSEGTIKLYLYPQYAKQTVENFIALANSGYYTGTEFHRVVAQLLVQAGDPSRTGTGGESSTGMAIPNEFCSQLHNYYGAVGMASSVSGENFSQFYIITSGKITEDVAAQLRTKGYSEQVIQAYSQWGGAPHLDFRYTVFGQVFEGFSVLEKIANGKVGDQNYPERPVRIESVTIQTIS